MRILATWMLSATGLFAANAEDIQKYVTAPSDYAATESSALLLRIYKMTEDADTIRWTEWNQSWGPGGRVQKEEVTRRIVQPGVLVETDSAKKPKDIRKAEITWHAKEGWRRTTAFKVEDKWVVAFNWKGTQVRDGWIHWVMTAQVDGWGVKKQSKVGELFRVVHERINDTGWSILTYTGLIGSEVETGMIYYSASGVAPPDL